MHLLVVAIKYSAFSKHRPEMHIANLEKLNWHGFIKRRCGFTGLSLRHRRTEIFSIFSAYLRVMRHRCMQHNTCDHGRRQNAPRRIAGSHVNL